MAQHYIIDTILDGSIRYNIPEPSVNGYLTKKRLKELLSPEKFREIFKYDK